MKKYLPMNIKNFASLILSFFLFLSVNAQPEIELQPYLSGFNQPLGVVHANDDRLFVIEQRGLVKIIDGEDVVQENPFLDLSDIVSQSGSERGLLGLAFHPDFKENGYFFVNYTQQSNGNSVVSRFKTVDNNPNLADRESETQILTVEQPFPNHNGGQLLFGPDGYLYLAFGDGGDAGDPQNNAQNLNTFLGKILRIDVEVDEDGGYSIPADNPFINNENAHGEIWALGLRNPWRNSFDRLTDDFWIADVGQNAREEVNFSEAGSAGGANYGWRCYEGDIAYNSEGCPGQENFVFPVFDYPHAASGCSGSITGGFVYRGAVYNEMYGKYFFADFCTGNLYYISSAEEDFEGNLIGNYEATEYTSFGEDQYGELYVVLGSAGEIQKVMETGDCMPVAEIKAQYSSDATSDTVILEAVFNPALEYQWNKNGEPMPGETGYILHATEQGTYSVNVTNPANNCTNMSAPEQVSITSASTSDINDLRIYPNPTENKLNIEGLPVAEKVKISLINEAGASVFNQNHNTEKITIRTTNFSPGLYILQVKNNSTVLHRKIVIQ